MNCPKCQTRGVNLDGGWWICEICQYGPWEGIEARSGRPGENAPLVQGLLSMSEEHRERIAAAYVGHLS